MTNELKPCPFCGKVPTVYGAISREYASGRWAKGHREAYWVHPRCELGCLIGTAHAAAYGATRGIEFTTEEAAIEAWNTRAERTCQAEYRTGGNEYGAFYCSACNNYMDENDRYCPNCGAKVVEE